LETRRRAAVNWVVPCFKLPMMDGAVLGARPGYDWVFGGGGAVSPVAGRGFQTVQVPWFTLTVSRQAASKQSGWAAIAGRVGMEYAGEVSVGWDWRTGMRLGVSSGDGPGPEGGDGATA
jgi:hypothetical protein